jgi:hypothetical protein
MTMSASTAFFDLLRSVANETAPAPAASFQSSIPVISHPAQFLMDALAALGCQNTPPSTRTGIDAACDLLFSHPAIIQLIADPNQSAALQAHFADRYLPLTTAPHFRDHWTYIIRPAWEQHTAIQATAAATAT